MNELKMKVYEIEYMSGEKEWIAARSVIEAIQTVCTVTSLNIYEFDYQDTITEIPEEKWKEMNIVDEYGVVDITFAQWMAINKRPDMIACTAY